MKLRQMMRGYRILKSQGRLGALSEVNDLLAKTPLNLQSEDFSKFVLGVAYDSAEIMLRQYLLIRLCGPKLNSLLLMSASTPKAPIVAPLPAQWRRMIDENGFKIGHKRSAVLWQLYTVMLLAHGVLQIVKIFFERRHFADLERRNNLPFAYFMDLKAPNLACDESSKSVMTWYFSWSGREKNLQSARHSVVGVKPTEFHGIDIFYQPGPLLAIAGLYQRLRFGLWSLGALVSVTFGLVRGKWASAILLGQSALSAKVRCSNDESLASVYLFHNSGYIYRPTWTYEVEARGSKVCMYYYSTNIEGFQESATHPDPPFGYKVMNWPNYIVWDEWQHQFIKRVEAGRSEIVQATQINFSDNSSALQTFSKPVVGVFDVTPHRESRYRTLGLAREYYVPLIVNAFLADIVECVGRVDCIVAMKEKRDVGKLAHPAYRYATACLLENSYVERVDSDISAARLISSCEIVISIPFTSTALTARNQGKFSAYYDSSCQIVKDDRGAHGITILRGKAELIEWLLACIADG